MRQKPLSVIFAFLLCLVSGTALAQGGIQVSGKVIDDLNETLPGVSVQVKGTTIATITDIDGNYRISVPDKKAVLVFSYIGYESQELAVGNKTVINVTMGDDTQTLNEIVVVGYGTARKGDVTGALTTLRPDDKDAAKALTLDNLLNGKVAGLVVSSSSATVGSASSVTIRGASSLRGDNQPLYVIDNVPQASTGEFSSSGISGDYQINQDPLASLNPADIEDITVLKDASATAIYGSRGANGVILITTKKGRSGKAKVNVSANFTIAEATNLYEMMDLYQYATYQNSRYTSNPPYYIVGDEVRYVFSDALANYDPDDPDTYNVITYRNWQKEIYRTAFSQNYSVSVNGGSDNTTYYVSANFKNIKGTVENTGIKQGDMRMNLSAQISPAVKLDVGVSGAIRQNNMMAGGNSLGGSTTSISRTALDYRPYLMPDDDPSFTDETKTTPLSWLNDYEDVANDKTFKASISLTWKINDHFTYQLRAGGNLNTNERKRWYGLELYQGMNNQGLLSKTNVDKSNVSVENILNYNTKVKDFLNIDAMIGVTYEDYDYLVQNVIGNTFTFYEMRENGLHMAGNIVYSEPTQKDYQLASYLGRVNLSFWDKYLVTASLRADGSSKFAKGNRWGYFPSGSLAWRAEQEEFLQDVDWLHQLKARLSFGMTGNQSIDPYSTFSMYGSSSTVYYADGDGNQLTAFTVTNLSNSSLKWEKTTTWDFGIDFGLWESRLSGTLDLYHKKTTDLLISRDLPGSAGFASTYYNQGSLTNKGIEFALNAHIIDKKDWKWDVSANIGYNSAKIGDLGLLATDFGCLGERVGYYGNSIGDHFGVANIFLEGEAPGLFLGYKTQGIVQTDDVMDDGTIRYIKSDGTYGYYTSTYSSEAGDIKFVDMNGDGTIDENDRTIIGDPNPDFTYGFSTSITWKDLTLSAQFQGVQGRDLLNTNNRYVNTPGTKSGMITKEAYENMWTEDNPSNLYPSSTFTVQNYVLDRYVEDASYLRCSDITLSYVVPRNWLKKIGFSGANVYLSVKNAFIITDYSGYDPEANSFAFDGLRPGIDMSSYPSTRSYILGLSLTF